MRGGNREGPASALASAAAAAECVGALLLAVLVVADLAAMTGETGENAI